MSDALPVLILAAGLVAIISLFWRIAMPLSDLTAKVETIGALVEHAVAKIDELKAQPAADEALIADLGAKLDAATAALTAATS